MICFSCVWIFSSVYIYIAIFPQMYSRQSFFLLSISLFTVRMTFLLCKSFEFHDVLFFSSLFLELLESFSKCHFLWRYHKVFPYSHQKVTFYDAIVGCSHVPTRKPLYDTIMRCFPCFWQQLQSCMSWIETFDQFGLVSFCWEAGIYFWSPTCATSVFKSPYI